MNLHESNIEERRFVGRDINLADYTNLDARVAIPKEHDMEREHKSN